MRYLSKRYLMTHPHESNLYIETYGLIVADTLLFFTSKTQQLQISLPQKEYHYFPEEDLEKRPFVPLSSLGSESEESI